MSIREGHPADLPALLSIQSALSDPNPELLASALSGVGLVLVSPDAGDPVGYLLAIPGRDEAHVAELAVAPEARREGRASALLSAAADRLATGRITLAVEPDNEAARRCYEANGFEVIERDPDYFDGDPALIMALDRNDRASPD